MHYVHLSCSQFTVIPFWFGEYSTKICSLVKFSMDGTLHYIICITMQTCTWMFLIDSKKLINSSEIRSKYFPNNSIHLWLNMIIYEFWMQKETQLIRSIHISHYCHKNEFHHTDSYTVVCQVKWPLLCRAQHIVSYIKFTYPDISPAPFHIISTIFHRPTIFGNEIAKIAASQEPNANSV